MVMGPDSKMIFGYLVGAFIIAMTAIGGSYGFTHASNKDKAEKVDLVRVEKNVNKAVESAIRTEENVRQIKEQLIDDRQIMREMQRQLNDHIINDR